MVGEVRRFVIGRPWFQQLDNVTENGCSVYRCKCPESSQDRDLRCGYMFLHKSKSQNMWIASHRTDSAGFDLERLAVVLGTYGDPRQSGRHTWLVGRMANGLRQANPLRRLPRAEIAQDPRARTITEFKILSAACSLLKGKPNAFRAIQPRTVRVAIAIALQSPAWMELILL